MVGINEGPTAFKHLFRQALASRRKARLYRFRVSDYQTFSVLLFVFYFFKSYLHCYSMQDLLDQVIKRLTEAGHFHTGPTDVLIDCLDELSITR